VSPVKTAVLLTLMMVGCSGATDSSASSSDTGGDSAGSDTATCESPPTRDEFVPALLDAFCPWVASCAADGAKPYGGDAERCHDIGMTSLGDSDKCLNTCILDTCLAVIEAAPVGEECTDDVYNDVMDQCMRQVYCPEDSGG